MKYRFTTIAIATATLAGSAWAVNLPGPVVDSQWLAKNRSEVQVVDIRSDKSFTVQPAFETDKKSGKKVLTEVGGHLADALQVPFGSIRADRMLNGQKVSYLLPEKADFEKIMQTAGLRADLPIVIVTKGSDPSEIDEGLRLFWQLKYYGEDRIALLDGGMAAWLAEERDTVVVPASATAGNWKATAERKELLATPEDVANAGNDVQLVDGRGAAQYYGIGKRDYVYAPGHIKGAKMLPPELLFRKDGPALKFFSADTYRSIFTMSGINADQPAVTYCNSGHLAAGPWFIEHELVGNKHVRLFDGSMHLWTLQKRPLESVTLAPLPATCTAGAATPGC
jgi:thiosulfate/3-mercaptopyruvate sulfurtransferase